MSSGKSPEQHSSNTHEPNRTVDPVAGKTVAEILGEIVWLMTQDPKGREMKVADVEALVMPAILQRRFHLKYAQMPDMRSIGSMALQPVEVSIYNSSTDISADEPAAIVFTLRGQKINAE